MAQTFLEEVIDQQQWLEPTGDALQQAIGKVARREGPSRAVKDALHGVWFGHPLHPALTDIPVGSWSATLILDMLSLGGNRAIKKGADATLSIGLVGSLGAALSGLADWQETYGRERRIGLLHGLLNATAATLYTASLVQRRRRRRGAGILLSSLGYGVVLLSSYLGGELVFDRGTGVNHAAWLELPDEFTPVMDDAALLPDKPTRAMAGSTPVLLVRQGGSIYALAAVCTHAGGPLDEGELVGCSMICPWHGSQFSLKDGKVEAGPATVDEPAFETRVRNGKIEVRRAASAR
ncbi:MAG TPA: Rieske 2Fe-2S domain-containing protein [Ktedonobacterales bacterium]|nr:Rieske 2Fe-2S domain-containing protein [Ktedonobacterales bacterium]